MHSRRLTISRLYPERRAAWPTSQSPAPMPFLRLHGRWLERAGFAVGTNVRVEVQSGRLVIEVDPQSEAD
jgi:Toxin SymE, type I toxin-antitoxin system